MSGLSWMLKDGFCRDCLSHQEDIGVDLASGAILDSCPACGSDDIKLLLSSPNVRPNIKGFKVKRYGPGRENEAHSREEDNALKAKTAKRLHYSHVEDDTTTHRERSASADIKRHRAWKNRQAAGGDAAMKEKTKEGVARQKESIKTDLQANRKPTGVKKAAAPAA